MSNWFFLPHQPMKCARHGRQSQFISVPVDGQTRCYCLQCAAEVLLAQDVPAMTPAAETEDTPTRPLLPEILQAIKETGQAIEAEDDWPEELD